MILLLHILIAFLSVSHFIAVIISHMYVLYWDRVSLFIEMSIAAIHIHFLSMVLNLKIMARVQLIINRKIFIVNRETV